MADEHLSSEPDDKTSDDSVGEDGRESIKDAARSFSQLQLIAVTEV